MPPMRPPAENDPDHPPPPLPHESLRPGGSGKRSLERGVRMVVVVLLVCAGLFLFYLFVLLSATGGRSWTI